MIWLEHHGRRMARDELALRWVCRECGGVVNDRDALAKWGGLIRSIEPRRRVALSGSSADARLALEEARADLRRRFPRLVAIVEEATYRPAPPPPVKYGIQQIVTDAAAFRSVVDPFPRAEETMRVAMARKLAEDGLPEWAVALADDAAIHRIHRTLPRDPHDPDDPVRRLGPHTVLRLELTIQLGGS